MVETATMNEENERRFLVAGNWKMNGDKKLINKLTQELLPSIPQETLSKVDVVIAPQFPYLSILTATPLPSNVHVAAQNVSQHISGAYTGEVSPLALEDLGVTWCIIGHYERRTFYHESDEIILQKLKNVTENTKLKVILCIGETLSQRDQDKTTDVLNSQLNALLPVLAKIAREDRLTIAYEPIWAIGTGVVATPQEVKIVHQFIREWFKDNVGPDMASTLRILYGGSVTASNCNELASLPNVDGFLVGGASLKPEFRDIILSKLQCKSDQ